MSARGVQLGSNEQPAIDALVSLVQQIPTSVVVKAAAGKANLRFWLPTRPTGRRALTIDFLG